MSEKYYSRSGERLRDLILPCTALLVSLLALVVEIVLNFDSAAAVAMGCLVSCGAGVVVGVILGRAR